jgi:integral membrane protein (TIGR00529 family)
MIVVALFVSLSLMMFLINKKHPMGRAILLGALVLALLSGLSPGAFFGVFFNTIIEKRTIELVASVYLIGVLGSMMQGFGVMDRMIEYLERSLKSVKMLLVIIPTLLSAFTVAGSAVFAAPVIDVLGDKVEISKERKAAINLYMRHAWYFVLPITPSIVYAAFLADVSVWAIIKVQVPASIASLTVAYLVYIAPLQDKKLVSTSQENKWQVIGKTLLYTCPLFITVALVIWVPFYLALLAGCLAVFLIRVKPAEFKKMLVTKQGLNMVFAAAAIMVFKGVIDSIPEIRLLIQEAINRGISLDMLIIVLSFVLGYVLANPQALIGMLFPILLPLVSPEKILVTAAVINIIGFVGYFISPIHLCQALTNEFFGVSTKNLYKEYKITVPVMFISGIIIYLLYM